MVSPISYGTDGAFAVVWEIDGALKILEVSPGIRDVEARDNQVRADGLSVQLTIALFPQ